MSEQNCAVILAAGEGKRMKRNRPKCLSPVLFKPMLQWVIDSASEAGIGSVCVVTGFLSNQVEAYLSEHDPEAVPVLQAERKGTGHAVMMAADFLRSRATGGNVLILNGDAPFLDPKTVAKALAEHKKSGNSVTVISALLEDPTGYGRIIRAGGDGALRAIVEQKDASTGELAVREVNSGAFWFRTDDLLDILPQIKNANVQGEYYLTDAVALLIAQGKRAGACTAGNANAVRGANDCLQLHELNVIARDAVLAGHMRDGVDIPCTDGVVIGPDVTIGKNCTILPGTMLRGRTVIGSGCVIGPNTVLNDCNVGPDCILDSIRGTGCTVEPHTHAEPFTEIRNLK
ncbi:MAG TPA: NTP transferase domain-containing protein [Armatimonadota bacterium]|nr:NTP transferase domain-containing protein [Armatimonadota bacterium]